jgi:hypothetical protein
MPDAIPLNRTAKAAPKSDASIEELLAFERMLSDLSARFANVPVEKVEQEIRVVQAILLKFLGFDRCTFAEFQDDGSLVVLSSTAVEGVEATPSGPLPSQLDWFVARLRPARPSRYRTLSTIFRQKRLARPNISGGPGCIRI